MKKINIAIASDHAGYNLKERLKIYLKNNGYNVEDFGTNSDASVDYPDFIHPAAKSVSENRNHIGIVLGGSGNGEAMAANKVPGIRCALCWNEVSAKLAKQHNNANMISIGARLISEEDAVHIVKSWLNAEFEGGRHTRRIEKIEKIDE